MFKNKNFVSIIFLNIIVLLSIVFISFNEIENGKAISLVVILFGILVLGFSIIFLSKLQLKVKERNKAHVQIEKYDKTTKNRYKSSAPYSKAPSLEEGMASITNLSGQSRYSELINSIYKNKYSDSTALKSDWEQVGLDITSALYQFSDSEQNGSKKSAKE